MTGGLVGGVGNGKGDHRGGLSTAVKNNVSRKEKTSRSIIDGNNSEAENSQNLKMTDAAGLLRSGHNLSGE